MDQLHLFVDRRVLRVAVVEPDDRRAAAVARRLGRSRHYELQRLDPLDMVAGRIDVEGIDVVVLGVDGTATATAPLRWLTRHAPTTAVVALHHDVDLEAGLEMVVTGAQDVLPFAEATAARLDRVIRAAVTRKHMEVAALSSAMADPVTGMASRGWMIQRLEMAVAHAASCAEGWQVAVLFCDLDRFKAVNDALGHTKGDELLRLVAERLRSVVRAEDPVTRFGGDEFVILLEGHRVEGLAHRIALRAVAALAAPFELDGHEISVLASVGLAVHRPGESASELLDHADLALFQAKRRGRNRIEVFDDDLRHWNDHQQLLAHRLAEDLRGDRLAMANVAVWDLESGEIVGAVCSPEWPEPADGDVLVDVAVRHGLGPDLGRWVIRRSISDAARHARRSSRIVVDLPPGLVGQPAFVGWVADELAASDVDPARLVLAIGEAELADTDLVGPTLDGLDRLGVSVALEGFGSGSSSLALFGSIRVDEVLLAPQLVAGIAEDAPRRAVVEGLLRIADAIGQRVVARGPASLADVEVLAAMGCTTVMTALDVSAVRLHARTVLPDTTAQRATAESLVLR